MAISNKRDEDGVFSEKTQSAVKQHQNDNGLDLAGSAGNQTLNYLNGSLLGMKMGGNASGGNNTGFQYAAYEESDAVKQAQEMLQQQMNNKPGEYQSAWQAQLNDTINKILNREKFSYDLNGDALYQQYKDQYMNQGRMAMMDTMGQAAAMTGGYGNSYAQNVGQQAYQGYLQQLNNKIPELYQMALNKYQMEGDALATQYGILGAQEQQDYGRYRDQVSDWQGEMDRLRDQYYTERDYDYGKWADDRNFGYSQYIDERNYKYQTERDRIADEQWQAEFNEAMRRYDQEWAAKHPKAKSSGGSSKSGNPKGSSTGNPKDDPQGDSQDGLQGGDDGFTGTTYSEAVAYMKSKGVSGASASGIMTANEFKRSSSSRKYKSYQEYLQYTSEKLIANKG